MFVDTYFRFEEGRNACLGVNRDSKKSLLKKICVGMPKRLTKKQINEINEIREKIYKMTGRKTW